MKRCFVISPIGPENSEIREHANDVYDFIVEPAMKECGIQPIRSDHLREPGKISHQMFREILTDDLCIAVLTGHNPNVFYELAVAQSAQRPVILLIQKGEPLPFDIHDLRCVYYDLKPRPLRDGIYVKEIIDHVKALVSSGWKAPNIFGELMPFRDNSNGASGLAFFERAENYGTSDAWAQLLENTKNTFYISGLTLQSWKRSRGFSALLKQKAEKGCKVRILVMDENNPVFPPVINRNTAEEFYESIETDLKLMYQYFKKIADSNSNIDVRKISSGCPHYQITITDQFATIISYLYSEPTAHSPLWQIENGSALYSIILQEFDSLWKANEREKSL